MDLPVFLYIQSEFLVGAISTRRFPCEYHLRAETWVLPLMVHLEMFYVKGTPVLCKRPKNSLTPVTSFSSKQPSPPPTTLLHSGSPSRPHTIEPSETCGPEVTIPISPPCLIWGEASYLLARCLLRG